MFKNVFGNNVTISNVTISGNGNVFTTNGVGGTNVVEGNGKVVKQKREISNFSKIEISGSAIITCKAESETSLSVEAESNLMDMLKTQVKGNTLCIWVEGSFSSNEKIKIACSTQTIKSIKVSGSASLDVEDLSENEVDVRVSGSGSVDLEGDANTLNAQISGSGSVDCACFDTKNATLQVSGSGSIIARVKENLDASVSGSGRIKVKGSPSQTRISESGAGKVKVS